MKLMALEELEDGSMNVEIEMSAEEKELLIEAGVRVFIACAISGVKLDDAYELIFNHRQETASLTLDAIPCDSFWSIGPTCFEIYEVLEPQINN